MKFYVIRLKAEERDELTRLVKTGREAAYRRRNDPGCPGRAGDRGRLLDLTLAYVAIACSDAPVGRTRWTLHMLCDELKRRRVVRSISHETVRKVLKKTSSSRGDRRCGVSRHSRTAFVCAMENVLEVYTRPYDASHPVICMDECKQCVQEIRPPQGMRPPGSPLRRRYGRLDNLLREVQRDVDAAPDAAPTTTTPLNASSACCDNSADSRHRHAARRSWAAAAQSDEQASGLALYHR